ncbi:D-amino-acid transaminase [Peribacillus cavernae]|uniref:D-alanine aminotransferase n=1 Tax=Peribacillus cavernae TaxID=1674310 RepID=A0A3S1BB34_9BACI|nr:D-amino-acid transaminase [Peribacillus cavernae]MDQ0220304.1 D-alanine transaminase [Peribacillus cavernae]RUQ31962.1 D-amino-acid transaminase [Peribacillus cavernae]
MEKVILNGKITLKTDIKVDFEDRGYQFGDGIYEVIRVYNGQLFTSKEHLNRLMASAKSISLAIPFTAGEIEGHLQQLIQENQLENGMIYMQFTRGVSPRNHAFPAPAIDSVYVAYTKPILHSSENATAGVKTILTEDIRWLRCDIKSLNLLGNILAKQKAADAGCFEALQHRDGIVTEGSSSNVSIVINGKVKTHPATNLILNGISRQVMLGLCKDNGIPFSEQTYTTEELLQADEVFLSSTTAEILPVIEIDGKAVGNGTPGPFTRKLQKLFQDEVAKQCGSKQQLHL